MRDGASLCLMVHLTKRKLENEHKSDKGSIIDLLSYIKEGDVMNRIIKRGQIYFARLNKGCGSEQYGIRPVLIIQNNKGNLYSPTVIVACISSKTNCKSKIPTHYYLSTIAGLRYPSIVMLEQITVIDKSRLIRYLGCIPSTYMMEINNKIKISLDIY